MDVSVLQGEIQKIDDEALVVNLFEGVRPGGATAAVDRALGGAISAAVDLGDFSGGANQTLLLYGDGRIAARRVLVVGLGAQDDFGPEEARRAAATAAKTLRDLGVARAATVIHGAGAGGLDVASAAQAVAEASYLACYRFEVYRRQAAEGALKKLRVVEFDRSRMAAARRGVRTGLAIARGTALARDLGSHPGNAATPSYLARTARQMAKAHSLQCRIHDEAALKRLKMGALLGVSQGSAQGARFIVLEHNKKAGGRPLVFVGKGVTFDTGGISLKGGQGMEDMKHDMSGAAAVLGAMQTIGALGLKRYVVGLIPAVENMPGSRAVKPGDILTAMSGTTIEVINTDAEGRLILADALCYARRYKPAAVVDLATLTGACVVALGHHASGLMGNDEDLIDRLRQAGETTGERVWQLPLWPEYADEMKSAVADLKNAGSRAGGTLTAAGFLSHFAGDMPWAHLDIAGTAWATTDKPYIPKGSVGVGVRLLTQLARDWSTKA